MTLSSEVTRADFGAFFALRAASCLSFLTHTHTEPELLSPTPTPGQHS